MILAAPRRRTIAADPGPPWPDRHAAVLADVFEEIVSNVDPRMPAIRRPMV
jgi:hypothetical protein